MDYTDLHTHPFVPHNNFMTPFPPPQHFRPTFIPPAFLPIPMFPAEIPYLANPSHPAFRPTPLSPLPPNIRYSRSTSAFRPRVQPLPPFASNRHTPFPSSDTSTSCESSSYIDSTSVTDSQEIPIRPTIHDIIAERLLRDWRSGFSRAGIVALIEGYNSQAHPRDVIKIEHPTEVDENIEAAINRLGILRQEARDARRLEVDVGKALSDVDEAEIRQQNGPQYRKASEFLISAIKLSEMLENWLMQELQSKKWFEPKASAEELAEIGQKAEETLNSWVEDGRQILLQISQICSQEGTPRANSTKGQRSKLVTLMTEGLQEELRFYNATMTRIPESMYNNLRTALEIVAAYPKDVINNSVPRAYLKSIKWKAPDVTVRKADDILAGFIADYLLQISALKMEIDKTVFEYSRRVLARINNAETERDVALRLMMQKELQFYRCWTLIPRRCKTGRGETFKTWVSNTLALINRHEGAQEKFEAPFQPLDDSPDWVEVYAASLFYDYGRLVMKVGENFDESMIKLIENLTHRIQMYETGPGNVDPCEGTELLRQLRAFEADKAVASLESLRPLGAFLNSGEFEEMSSMPETPLDQSFLRHQYPEGIDSNLVLGYLEHLYLHNWTESETLEEIVEVTKRILARAKASEGAPQLEHGCGRRCRKGQDTSGPETETPDFVLVDDASSKNKGKGKAIDCKE